MLAKISQSVFTNNYRSQTISYKVGDLVMLSTLNRRRDYSGEHRVAKFMPHFDGPYLVTNSFPEASTVTLDIPHAPNLFPTFHTSHVKPFMPNDDSKFPLRTLERPGPITTASDGSPEYLVEKIINHKSIGHGTFKYLVRWTGYRPEDDIWISTCDLEVVFKGPVAWTGKTTKTGLIATKCNRTSGCRFHTSYPFAVAGSGLNLNGQKPVITGCHQLQPVFIYSLSRHKHYTTTYCQRSKKI